MSSSESEEVNTADVGGVDDGNDNWTKLMVQ
jgi:hypothetical protein